jgi:hypothetical protein
MVVLDDDDTERGGSTIQDEGRYIPTKEAIRQTIVGSLPSATTAIQAL